MNKTSIIAVPATTTCKFNDNHEYEFLPLKKDYWDNVQHENNTLILCDFDDKLDKRAKETKAKKSIIFDLSYFFPNNSKVDFKFAQKYNSESYFSICAHECKKVADDSVGEFECAAAHISISAGPFSHYIFKYPETQYSLKAHQFISLQDSNIKSAEFIGSELCSIDSIHSTKMSSLKFNNVGTVVLNLHEIYAPNIKNIDLFTVKKVNLSVADEYLTFADLNFGPTGYNFHPARCRPEILELMRQFNPNCVLKLNPQSTLQSFKFLNVCNTNVKISDVCNVSPNSTEPIEIKIKDLIFKLWKYKTDQIKKFFELTDEEFTKALNRSAITTTIKKNDKKL